LVIKFGPLIISFTTTAEDISNICPIFEIKAEAATMEMSAEYARMDTP
jgi:hypothetical protein